jgi:hypothetical protein
MVFIRVQSVKALPEWKLLLTFNNGEEKIFDTSLYLNKGYFTELQNISYFNSVVSRNGTVEWPNGQDFCPDTLYLKSISAEF